jgi:hypothetical protein
MPLAVVDLERFTLNGWYTGSCGTQSILTFPVDLDIVERGYARAGRLFVMTLEPYIAVAEYLKINLELALSHQAVLIENGHPYRRFDLPAPLGVRRLHHELQSGRGGAGSLASATVTATSVIPASSTSTGSCPEGDESNAGHDGVHRVLYRIRAERPTHLRFAVSIRAAGRGTDAPTSRSDDPADSPIRDAVAGFIFEAHHQRPGQLLTWTARLVVARDQYKASGTSGASNGGK